MVAEHLVANQREEAAKEDVTVSRDETSHDAFTLFTSKVPLRIHLTFAARRKAATRGTSAF